MGWLRQTEGRAEGVRRVGLLTAAGLFASSLALGACAGGSETRTTGTVREGATVPRSARGTTAPKGTTVGTTRGTTPDDEPTTEEIRGWQSDLNTVGCNAGYADGEMGPGTRAALRSFQIAVGLEATGEFDDDSVEALNDAVDDGAVVCVAPQTTSTLQQASTTAPSSSTSSSTAVSTSSTTP